jgi:hypothetical protein
LRAKAEPAAIQTVFWSTRRRASYQCNQSGPPLVHVSQETNMAKGQKKSNKEVRKPKQEKAKPAPAGRSFLDPAGAKGR